MNFDKNDGSSRVKTAAGNAAICLGSVWIALWLSSINNPSQFWDKVCVLYTLMMVVLISIGSVIHRALSQHWVAKIKCKIARIQL